MNKERIKTLKNTLCYILAFLLASLGCLTLLNFFRPSLTAHAGSSSGMKEIDISNGNFNEGIRSSYPYSPNNFNDYIYNTEVSGDADPNVSSGIVKLDDLDDEDFASRLSGISRTGALDQYVLMIDSYDYDLESAYTTNFGYRTASNIHLDAGKNYMISVDAYTLNNSNIASMYLYNGDEVFAQFKNVKSYNTWTSYYFYVQTNDNEALDLKLGLYLEGAGTVLYDNVACYELNTSMFNTFTSTIGNNENVVNLVDNVAYSYNVNNSNQFVNTLDNTNRVSLRSIDSVIGKNGAEYTTIGFSTEHDGARNSNILINNIKETYIKYATEDDFLTFEQSRLYKVTIRVKAENLSGKASLNLVQTGVETDKATNGKAITISSDTSSDLNNDYQDYSFYINSHPTESSNYRLEIALGESETLTSGKLYISNVTVTYAKYEQYSSASNKIDLTTKSVYSDSPVMMDNGSFDGIKINDYNNIYPATPIDWTVSTGSNKQYYGVVNSDSDIFTTLGIKSPLSANENENLLLMYNTTNDTLSYTSESKSITADSYHKFQISTKTINSSIKVSLVATKDNKEIILSTKTISSPSWQELTLFLHAGHEDLDVSLRVELITTAGAGYAYIDNAKFDFPETSKTIQQQYESASDADFVKLTDLSNPLATDSTTPWSGTPYFTGNGDGDVDFGIIPLTKMNSTLTQTVIGAEDIENFSRITTNVLGLKVNDGYYTISSDLGYALKSEDGTFYKISVSVFTKNITVDNLEEDEKLSAVTISLTNFEDNFTEITTEGKWTTYTFYIDPTTATTTYLNMSLGNSEQYCSGTVFFGDIVFEKIDQDTYDQFAVANDTTKVLETVTEPKDDEEDTETNDSNVDNSNWIYYIPSILFAVAIVIAIVGVMVRKIKWKKPTKKSKNAYDRHNTVSKQVLMRRATTLRENKLAELNKDLTTLSTERAKFEIEYKQDITKLREMKIKRASASEISKLEKEIKRAQKQSASIGVTINNIEAEIEYTKSDAYINSLMKKIEREGLTNKNEDEQ